MVAHTETTKKMPKNLEEAYMMIYGAIQEDAPIIRVKKILSNFGSFGNNNNEDGV